MGKILIVEDEVILSKMYQKILTNNEYEVLLGKNGEEGLRIALSDHPDLILLDLVMPKMGGLEMLELLRNDPWGANVPVIILTNLDTSQEILNSVIKNHPTYYLIKANIEFDVLMEKIKNILEVTKNKQV